MTIPIVALDVPTAAEALAMVDRLGEACRFYKIGSELFTAEGPRVLESVSSRGCNVFLDLKFHDIPNTVRQAVRSAASLGASLLTVHASGGRAMLEAARAGAAEGGGDGTGEGCRVLAVTVLTSLDAGAVGEAWGREVADLEAEVLRLARLARAAGVHGVVCSGREAAAVREACGDAFARLVPGVRLPGGDAQDQARVVTPEAAAGAGATYVVIGRAVTAAADPVAAMRAVHDGLRQGRGAA